MLLLYFKVSFKLSCLVVLSYLRSVSFAEYPTGMQFPIFRIWPLITINSLIFQTCHFANNKTPISDQQMICSLQGVWHPPRICCLGNELRDAGECWPPVFSLGCVGCCKLTVCKVATHYRPRALLPYTGSTCHLKRLLTHVFTLHQIRHF